MLTLAGRTHSMRFGGTVEFKADDCYRAKNARRPGQPVRDRSAVSARRAAPFAQHDLIYASGGAESMLALRRRRGGYTTRIILVVQT